MRLLAGVLFVLFAVLPGAAYAACAAERTPPALAGFDAFARAVMAEWRVPGLALGIIRDGETLYCAGYGFADVDNLTAATPETVFAIGSISKSFTVAGLAMLVDEGRLDWDAPVQSVLPGFALAQAAATAHVTPRDKIFPQHGQPDGLPLGQLFRIEDGIPVISETNIQPLRDIRDDLENFRFILHVTALAGSQLSIIGTRDRYFRD